MKKLFILMFMAALLPAAMYAQPFGGGFFAGITAGQVDGDTYFGYNKVGLTAGGYIMRDINRNLNWKAELRYIQKGAYHQGTPNNPSLYKLAVHYAEIPFMIQYHLTENIILDAGLAPGIFLFYKEEDENGQFPEENPFHLFSLDACGGLNYMLNDHIIAGLRYSYSVLPIRDHPSGQTYRLNRGQYSNLFSFTVYYQFK